MIRGILLTIAAVCIAYAGLFLAGAIQTGDLFNTEEYASPHLAISVGDDDALIGSATYLGNGYALTAAHVVGGAYLSPLWKTIRVVDEFGNEYDGTVALFNLEQDYALVRIRSTVPVDYMTLDCGPQYMAQPLQAYGLQPLGNVIYLPGEIVGHEFVLNEEMGLSVIPTNAALFPGMSGGAVVSNGQIIGINNAILMRGNALFAWGTDLSFFVPSSVFCADVAEFNTYAS